VRWVHRAENVVTRHVRIEGPDEPLESFFANPFIDSTIPV
jgi:hypothetical protein